MCIVVENLDRCWTSPLTVLRSVGPKLVPFCKTVAIYFVLLLPDNQPSFLSCLIKCAPILSLIFFVLLHGMNLSKEYAVARAILAGLICSVVGDALLCFDVFVPGMMMFGFAHINYVRAFGLRPFKLSVGIVIGCLACSALIYFKASLSPPLTACVVVYATLLSTMVWRALARVQLFEVEELWTWTKLCSSFGAILFMISDFLIGVHRFVQPVPYEQILIMFTYYAAQLGITLSVVDSRKARKED